MFSNIAPSSETVTIGIVLASIYAIIFTSLLNVPKRRSKWDINQKDIIILRKWWLRVPIALFFGFIFGYASFVWAYPWLINTFIGTRHTMEFVTTGTSGGGPYECLNATVEHGLFKDGPRAFCVSWHVFNTLSPGMRIRIVGPQSFLGINTDKVYLVKKK